MHQPTTQTRLRPFKPAPFGRYTLLMPLATGGMGEIFLARLDGLQGFEKLCVIKKILPHLTQDEDFVTRFVNEAKTLVKLSHGAIAQVLDMGLHDGEPYLALEFIDGKDLRKVAARARERSIPLPLTFVLYTMSKVLDALAYAHRKRDDDEKEIGLVHRDVSPQNILISYEGEVKVIDFGLAKSTLNVAKTNPSIVLGKFLYMSPEQARHQKVDRRSDLYSVGLCLYELMAGKNPFDEVPPGELMAKVASPQIAPIQSVEPLCPAPVAQTIAKALAVDPHQRFQTAEEFRSRLLATLLEIDPQAGPESCSRFMREAFSQEYATERKVLAALREQRTPGHAEPTAVAVAAPAAPAEPLGGRKDVPTAIRNLTEYAKRSMVPPFSDHTPAGPTELGWHKSTETTSTAMRPEQQPILPRPLPRLEPLSFAPSVRLKEDDGRASQTDRETMPSINLVAEVAARLSPEQRIEPLATPAHGTVPDPPPDAARPGSFSDLPLVSGDLESAPPSPWSGTETTVPAGVGLQSGRLLPLVITAPDLQPLPESVHAPSPRKKLVTALTGPLPAALKNKPLPIGQDTTGGRTASARSGFIWVVVPLVAVLAVAAFIGYTLWQEQIEHQLIEAEARRTPLGTPSNQDTRSREVDAPAPLESPEPEAVLDAGLVDDELSALTPPEKVEPETVVAPPPAPGPEQAVEKPPEKPAEKAPEPPPTRPKKRNRR